jgi:putative peptidoglycan lipid II flippase
LQAGHADRDPVDDFTKPTARHHSPFLDGGNVNGRWQAVRQRFAAVHSDHKRIALGAVWVAGFVLVGKLAGAAKEMAVAWRYGVSETVDAYQLASTLVFWLPGTLVSVVTIVLVPMLVRLRQDNAEDRALFLQELQGAVVPVGVILAALSLLFGQIVLPYLAGNLSAASHQMTWNFTLGMAPLAPLALMLGVYAARLMAQERQINTLLEGVPAAAILLFVLLWPPGTDIAPLLWGTVLGIATQTVWSWRLAGRTDGKTAMPSFTRRSRHWPELYKAVGVMAIGQFVMSLVTPLDQYTAAQLGDGAIATLGYANRVIALLLGLGAVAISRAALPVMSDLHAAGQAARAQDISVKWAAMMLGVGTLFAIVAWAVAPWAIKLLFERGAFSPKDTRLVTEVFRWGLVQVPFYFAGLVFVLLLASRGRYRAIAISGFVCLATKLPLNMFLSSLFGVAGISMATGLMQCASVVYLTYCSILMKRTRNEE